MLVEKVITTIVTMKPSEYLSNFQPILLQKLAGLYVGRCHGGAYVHAVTEIIRHSRPKFLTNRLTAEANCDVTARLLVEVYSKDDIIAGLRVDSIDDDTVRCVNTDGEMRIVVTLPDGATGHLKVGSLVVVRVIRAMYTPMRSVISVIGSIYVPRLHGLAYRVARAPGLSVREVVQSKITQADQAMGGTVGKYAAVFSVFLKLHDGRVRVHDRVALNAVSEPGVYMMDNEFASGQVRRVDETTLPQGMSVVDDPVGETMLGVMTTEYLNQALALSTMAVGDYEANGGMDFYKVAIKSIK
jgi:hypothetical protein